LVAAEKRRVLLTWTMLPGVMAGSQKTWTKVMLTNVIKLRLMILLAPVV
jgi:hypothetical protein